MTVSFSAEVRNVDVKADGSREVHAFKDPVSTPTALGQGTEITVVITDPLLAPNIAPGHVLSVSVRG